MPQVIPIADLDDPRLADYREVKDRQWLPAFTYAETRAPDPAAPWGKFMAEGPTVLQRLALRPQLALSVLVSPTRLQAVRADIDRLSPATPVYVLAQEQLERLVGFELHRGLLAIAARPRPLAPAEVLPHVTPWRPLVVLESIFNHDNIGGIFRSGAALGAGGVLLSPRCADPLYRKALRVAVGCVLLTPWAYAQDWPAALAQLRTEGIRVLAMTLSPSSMPLAEVPRHVDLGKQRVAILLGTEGPGLSAEAIRHADLHVRIPMAPGVDSLNVSVTAAIALAALARPN
jgi:tRNA G18 (ribose-2'-O)-methylase SpoU